MKLKKLNRILKWSVILVFVPMIPGIMLMEHMTVYYICVAITTILAIAWVVIVRKLWRCPYCEGYLGSPGMKITHCPKCGKELFGEP